MTAAVNKRHNARRHNAWFGTWLAAAALCWSNPFIAKSAAAAEMPLGVIELDETVISGNQELPKVLYIVPWQQPDGLPRIELEPQFAEAELFRRLYPPAYRRELGYHEAHVGQSTSASTSGRAPRASADSTVNDSKE